MLRIAGADEQAFRVLMNRHMARSIAVAERITTCNVDADDIGQEAFVRVWNAASSFDPGRAQFRTWLMRIVVNLSIDRCRKPRHRPIEDAGDIVSPDRDAIQTLIDDERQRMVTAALAELPKRQRAAIALFHMEGFTCRESAAIMQLSEKGFESLLIRARRKLKARLDILLGDQET
ncbi:MAG: sigma-70 family RNA polymerase sigma factor [Chitinophagales bacterium]|nr:sigma-70 family RNA polymerase sigma factor [Hyphomicrobiales bacterium]